MNHEVLIISLSAAVPLRIAEFKARGGPTTADFRRVRDNADIIASGSDNMMFRGGKKGEAAKLFNVLADALAVMSFVPGGVEFAGLKFESKAAE